ncbi:MAG: dipeptidyl-peptidase 3 family protein [Bacteroidota bacterium]
MNQDNESFQYFVEQFADLRILRYEVPGFENLSLNKKKLIYYLAQAALYGRDIIFDQHFKYNLVIRRLLESIIKNYKGLQDNEQWMEFLVYTKRVWFSNGIHHHYSTDKFLPGFSTEYFKQLLNEISIEKLPLEKGETKDEFLEKLIPVMFDPSIDAKRVNQDTEKGLVKGSASNFYENVTAEEVEQYYKKIKDPTNHRQVEHGLNTKLTKENGKIVEKTWKVGSMYSPAIEKIIFYLEKARDVAENDVQKDIISKLTQYYKTGNLENWDTYNIAWVKDTSSKIDFINGFVEVYGDPLGMKGTWESVVNFKDEEATKRANLVSNNAQWFEDHSPIEKRFKKEEVKGISAKVITVAQLGGDCYPSTPIGINLPNSDWVRKEHGSKSVTISNIIHAYHMASLSDGFLEEFAYDEEEIQLAKKYGVLGTDLHVDLHECLGHGSGQLLPGVSSEDLENYHSTIEETRADLFALYYVMDEKLIDLKIIPNLDVAKAEYNSYIRNGLMTQLTRIELGKDLEEAHMRNRQIIAKWCYEKGQAGNVIEKKVKDGKTYFVINDYEKLRNLFAELLSEVQRIKSEGDYQSAKKLVEDYGVKVDRELHEEVKKRYEKLNLAPYSGFINPVFEPVYDGNEWVDVKIKYPESYTDQMISYSKEYSFLPSYN